MGFSQSWSFLLLIIAAASVPCTLAATYTVGGTTLWTVPPSNTTYSKWAAGQTFNVSDILYFNFTTGKHDVVEVNESEYNACTSNSAIEKITKGPATVPLEKIEMHYYIIGMRYYICSVGRHCALGQKVAIDVVFNTTQSTTTTSPSAAAPLAGVAAVSFSIFSAIISYFLYI